MSLGSRTSKRLTSRTLHGRASSRMTDSSARAAERWPPPALKYTRSIDFVTGGILRPNYDQSVNAPNRGNHESFADMSCTVAGYAKPAAGERRPWVRPGRPHAFESRPLQGSADLPARRDAGELRAFLVRRRKLERRRGPGGAAIGAARRDG